MDDDTGMNRRKLLKIGATAAWVAPVIVASLESPAAAASPTVIGTPCSYVLVVFTDGSQRYITSLDNTHTTCVARDTISSAESGLNPSLAANCSHYSIVGSQLRYDAAPIAASPFPCPLTYVGQTISISSGFQIVFIIDHNGSHTCGSAGSRVVVGKYSYVCATAGVSSVTTCC